MRTAQNGIGRGPKPKTWIALELRYARAILATDPAIAADRFDEALSVDLARWPCQRARLLLAYRRWLRREGRGADLRPQLRATRESFDTLGCASWADQARRELRASGESSRRRDPSLRDQLTDQELQIAQLPADGLSNREIGQKLNTADGQHAPLPDLSEAADQCENGTCVSAFRTSDFYDARMTHRPVSLRGQPGRAGLPRARLWRRRRVRREAFATNSPGRGRAHGGHGRRRYGRPCGGGTAGPRHLP